MASIINNTWHATSQLNAILNSLSVINQLVTPDLGSYWWALGIRFCFLSFKISRGIKVTFLEFMRSLNHLRHLIGLKLCVFTALKSLTYLINVC